jgi:hypothetical protein
MTKSRVVTILRIMYPVWTLIAMMSLMFLPAVVIVPGNSAQTVDNLLNNEILYNLSIIGSLITQLIHIAIVLLLWYLFEGINKIQNGLLLTFGLISVPIAMFNTINLLAAQLAVNSSPFLSGLTNEQAQSLMMFFLTLNDKGTLIAQIFWGLWLFPLAALIYQSGYVNKINVYFLVVAGFGYFFASLGTLLTPQYSSSLLFTLFTIMSMGEILFMLWFVIGGAKIQDN